jgi:hypothetical protein
MDNQAMMISLPSLNWRRGLRRFWLLATLGLWIGLGTLQLPDLLTAPRVVIETDQVQKLRKLLEQYRQNALPDAVRDEVRSKLERGELTIGVRYNVTVTVAGVEQRASYPAEMEEGQVRTAANQWAASLSRNAWIKLAVIALAMPLAFIILTRLIAWGIRGFDDATSPTSAASSPSFGSTPPRRIASPPPPRTTPQNTPSTETGGYRSKVVPPLTTPPTTTAPDANTPAAPTPLKPQQYQLMTDQPPAESHKESGQQEPTLGSSSRRQSTTKPASIKLEI